MKRFFTLLLLAFMLIGAGDLFAQSQQYLHFDGTDDYTVTENASALILNEPAFSMTGWFYTDDLVYGQGMMGFRSGTNGFYIIQLADGILECRLNSTTGLHEYVAPAFTVLPEQWQHFAWVYTGSAVSLYLDGVLVGSSPASGTIVEDNVPFAVGRSILSSLDFYFGGRADDVTLYKRELNLFEIGGIAMNGPAVGDPDLVLHYKYNQGLPGADNTSITHAISEVESPDRDAELLGFALDGPESNFNGDLDASFQAITFPTPDNKLITDAPFDLTASSSSGLAVEYTVLAGPVTMAGSTVTLDGMAGVVTIEATQPGDGTFTAATPVTQSFVVIDPQQNVPHVNLTNPLDGDMIVPNLGPIHLAAIVDIDYPELFDVASVEFDINGDIVQATHWKDGHYTAFWTPPSYGPFPVTARAFNNFGAAATTTSNINLTNIPMDINAHPAFSGVIINTPNPEEIVTATLPSFMGAFDNITAHLDIACPPGQVCGEWDRVAHIEVKTHEGEWIEIIKYITPYGTACNHSLDVTDFVSTLQGAVDFRVRCTTFDTGYDYNLSFDYGAGTPDYNYSLISPLWHGGYDFGNPDDLQPVPPINFDFPVNTESAKIKLVASGHGWGENNSNNAAEFSENIHHLLVNELETFTYDNWTVCNPNPDDCSPQNGTWFYNRAGFCPGAISPFEDYDVTPWIPENQFILKFRMDEGYTDLCHPNAPACQDGVTPTGGGQICQNCNDGFNPHLIFASSIVSFSTMPIIENQETSIEELSIYNINVRPNPASDQIIISSSDVEIPAQLKITDVAGRVVLTEALPVFNNQSFTLNVKDLKVGMYQLHLTYSDQSTVIKNIVIAK